MESFYDWLFADQDLETIIGTLDRVRAAVWMESYPEIHQILLNTPPLTENLQKQLHRQLDSPWAGFVAAYMAQKKGRPEEACLLLNYLTRVTTETRLCLIAWCALRKLNSAENLSSETLGLIIEKAHDRNLETLALYADNSVRYIALHGNIITWQKNDERIISLIQQCIKTPPLGTCHETHIHEKIQPGHIRLTFLTSQGLYIWEGLPSASELPAQLMSLQSHLIQQLTWSNLIYNSRI